MGPKMLFSASLERHMAAYMQDVKMDELNQQYQLAQAKIVREGERMQLSQADIMNRLDQLKDEVKKRLEVTGAHFPLEDYNGQSSSVIEPIVESKRPPPLKTTSKGTIVGLKEHVTNPKLRKTPSLEVKPKAKSPMKQALEEAAGRPSKAKALSKSAGSSPNSKSPIQQAKSSPSSSTYGSANGSPTASEAPTVNSTMAIESVSGEHRGELPKSNFPRDQKKLKVSVETSKDMDKDRQAKALKAIADANTVERLNMIQSKLIGIPGYVGSGLRAGTLPECYATRKKVSKRKYKK